MHPIKKDTICKEFPKNNKDSPGLFPEAVVRRFSSEEMFLRIRKIHMKPPVLESLNEVVVHDSVTLFKKESPAQKLSYEFCGILKNTSGRLLGLSLFQGRLSSTLAWLWVTAWLQVFDVKIGCRNNFIVKCCLPCFVNSN